MDKAVPKIKKWKADRAKKKLPPSPTDIVRGIIATVLIKEFKQWDGKRFRHKNIYVEKASKDSYSRTFVKIGQDEVNLSEDLKKAIEKSYRLNQEYQLNKQKAEMEQRMLSNLEEFMK